MQMRFLMLSEITSIFSSLTFFIRGLELRFVSIIAQNIRLQQSITEKSIATLLSIK